MSPFRALCLTLLLVVAIAACGDHKDALNPLPEPNAWAASHPQPSEGVPFHLVIDFFVDDRFTAETVTVTIDGETIVQGAGTSRPEKHCNWWIYELRLPSGEHTVEFSTAAGLATTNTFALDEEATGLAQYLDLEDYDGSGEMPQIRWSTQPGPVGCA